MSREKDFSALWRACCALLLALSLSACGGGGSGGGGNDRNSGADTAAAPDPGDRAVVCETSDAGPTSEQCGQLFVGITDLEGDFIRYQVELVSLRLQRFDGTVVEVLPAASTVDFVEYADRAELVTAATLEIGNYVRGEITLDFTDADVRVDVDGRAEPARVAFEDGIRVRRVTLALVLDNRRPLIIQPELPALLELDFNLLAANSVDTVLLPPRVTLFPVVTAENDPPLPKPFRLRGPLLSVDERQVSYRIAVRPFDEESGRQGGVNIEIRGETDWEIDGERLFGSSGLSALAALPPDTETLAFGVFDRARRTFIADLVYAGSSVPGDTLDTLKGHVLAREGPLLRIIGARLLRTDGSVDFFDRFDLLLAQNTFVSVPRFPLRQETVQGISVGQRIAALGHWDEERPQLDLGEGRVRLLPTVLDSFLNARVEDEMLVTALEFGGRDALLFDYTDTGTEEALDADPDNYQVDISDLIVEPLAVGTPLRFRGYVTPFGSAPPDFDAISIEDFSLGGAQFLVSFLGDGSDIPFLTLDATGLSVNLAQELLGFDHYIRRGAVIDDLLSLFTVPRLLPVEEGGLFAIADDGIVYMYSDFGDFATDLDRLLAAGALVKRVYAEGGYRTDASTMSANSLIVVADELGNLIVR
ncbi:hypothetical protein [Microbulbifer magnicolonia]|uniref:hypothetical protein n=1 Tax=Microbulbifer magnicolonia TaxID=3109744 RepID=UPI002B415CE5|nr:hypothetical protein [Microbulbifer sp. GG15]